MFLDDLLYPGYHKVDISKSVFIVGSFRTGSTSLHRQLSMDEGRFVSTYFGELFFPFLSLFFLKERLDKTFGHERMKRLYNALLTFFFTRVLNEEVISRHPMTGYEAEEDDFLLSSWHRIGWYSIVGFPHPGVWMKTGKFSGLTEGERQKSLKFYERTMKKMLYHRKLSGHPNAIILSKSHQPGLMPYLKEKYPECKVLGITRHPKDAFTSWYGLAQAALECLKGEIAPTNVAVEAHLRFWDNFTQEELSFFRDHIKFDEGKRTSSDGTVSLVTFKEYISEPIEVIRSLYESWGIGSIEGTPFEKKLLDDLESHKAYKKKKTYKDDTLEELGISEEVICERYDEYLRTFNLIEEPKK